ncbi:hypothetical protein DXG01_005167 [Tephrocybe rancida]|nr:hypothetical protein DXG01_005167 [Tephrocybe rancida]
MIRATVPGVFYSYIVEPLALGSAITLTYLNHTQTRTSSSVLLVFWPLYLVGLAVWVRTTLTMGLDTGVVLALKSVVGGLGFLSFALECLGPEYGAEFANKLHTKNPLDTANIFTVWTSGWITPLMKKGASQLITESDIPPLRAHDESEHLGKNLQDVLTKHTLWKALFVSYGKPYAVAAVLKVLHDCLALLQPQLLRWLLSFMSRYQTGHYKDSPDGSEGLQGFVISVLMFAVSIAQTVALNQYFQRTLETGMRVRAGLVTAIYAKALVLSNDERTRASGDIVNLMSVDATRLQDLCTHGLLVISGPVQITLAFASLYNLLGWAALPIVVIMIISIPLNTFMMQVIQRSQAKLMKIRDKRARLMSELLANIKSFTKKLLEVRDNQELKTLKQHAFAWVGLVLRIDLYLDIDAHFLPLSNTTCLSGVAAAVSSKPLTPDIIFPAMTLFLLLQSPFIMIGQVTSSIIEGIVSVKRVSEFLNAGELQHDMRRLVTAPTPLKRGDEVLFIKDADFAWEKNAVVPTLEKIDLLVKKGDLFGVLGSVGAGKTSLLSAIIGQMTRKEGQVVLPGSIAYAPQNPWYVAVKNVQVERVVN